MIENPPNGLDNNHQEKLSKAVNQFLKMMNQPGRLDKQIQLVIQGLGAPQLPQESQEAMDQVVKKLRVFLPSESHDIETEEIENMIRAMLEESHV